MATKCFPGWRLGGTSPRFGHPPVPSRGGCPTTRRPQPRPGAPIWPAPSARFFAEPQPAINGGSARSCPACGGGGPRPDSGPPSAASGGEGGWRGHGSGWWGTPAAATAPPRPLRPLIARARRMWRAPAIGPRRPTRDRRHRDVLRLLAAGPAPSPASPPHARLKAYTRSGVRPTDIYALARDTPGRRSRDTPSAAPAASHPPRLRRGPTWMARARRNPQPTTPGPEQQTTEQRRRTGLAATTRPSDEKIAAWRRMYLEHHKDPDEPRRCAAVGCHSRFPCGRRLEAAELLIVAGVGVPSRE